MSPLLFVKLGGSLITDKRRRSTARLAVLRRLANELREVLQTSHAPRVLFGHGSGSFGHWEANQYGTRHGVSTPEGWYGFARVSAAALELNRLVTRSFSDAGVPVLSLQPSASARARGGTITSLELEPIRQALDHGLVPLVFGDVAFDDALGGTILSTEDLFVHLASAFLPEWIILLGNAPGVLDDKHEVVPTITLDTYPDVREYLRRSGYTDVTGGMADKVERMVELVGRMPNLRARIMSGTQPGQLAEALLDPADCGHGTVIRATENPGAGPGDTTPPGL